jgi:MoaA/NifB/PqqE/SkfB family radical SAM enzyme
MAHILRIAHPSLFLYSSGYIGIWLVLRRGDAILMSLKLNKRKAQLLSLKRLKGLPFVRKLNYISNAILGETIRARTFAALGLRLVEISLTDRCQCRCGHCFAATQQPLPEKDELQMPQICALIDDLSRLGVTEVCFSGGEPLLRHDILEIVSYAHSKGLVARLITNGILLDDQMVANLKCAGLSWCSLSIDSPRSEEHDAFRQFSGCFDKAIGGLRLLVKYKIPCSIITVARKELLYSGQLEEIVKIGKKLGVTVVRINFPVPLGRFINQDNQTLTYQEREKVRELLRYGNVMMEAPSEGTKCTAAVTKVNILPNGNVTPCVFVPLSYGNIREFKFSEIWKSMEDYSKRFTVNGQCPMCDSNQRERIYTAAENQDSFLSSLPEGENFCH